MRFRIRALALALLPLAAAAQEQETWNAHVQSTYVWQKKLAFHSPYEGPNSLSGSAEKSYSFTATAAFGWRVAPGTELYFDPEVAQGIPLSGLLGLAGFSNGELAKTSGAKPTFYRARLFMRQTFDLGGEQTAVASAANQLASRQAERRVVVTAGALSVLDLFDANTYAHDPRTQFMNWALMTHAAYDYAADSRGYTYGLAAEYFGDGWSVLAGRYAEPREPNQLKLDGRLMRHYGDQAELTRDYGAGSQGGTVRLLAFRMRTVMAGYADALALAGNGTPTLDSARQGTRTKSGIGLDLEHRLRDDVGLFARAMRADGRTETYAFTEADRSLSFGASVRGAAWQRPDDTLGLAAARSALSAAHRAFLERGGQTFFIGDGRLAYRPEQVIEAYYSASLTKQLKLSADWQRIAHPGYNADRGPASFYALRLHWEE